MQTLHEIANDLAKDSQIIADNLNPRFHDKKMSIRCIRHMIAALARNYASLYKDIGEEENV